MVDAVHLIHRKIVQLVHHAGTVVELHIVFELPNLDGAGGNDLVLCRQRGLQILGGKMIGQQRLGIDVDLDLALLATIGRGNGSALNRGQRRTNEILAKVKNVLFRKAWAGKRQLQNGDGGGVVVEDLGRGDAGRHLLQDGLRDRSHLRRGGTDVGAGVKEDLDDAHARHGLAFDVIDISDNCGKLTFVIIDHPASHFVGRQTTIGPNHCDHRDVDIGENIGRRLHHRHAAKYHDQDCQHDERVRSP